MSADPVIINRTMQEFGGRIYRRRHNGYYQSSGYPTLLHRDVWLANTGSLPKGHKMHVHHIDGDKGNNAFANLRLITPLEHAAEHHTPEHVAKLRQNIAIAQEAAKEWHGTPEGLAFHRANALAMREAWKADPRTYTCEVCGKEFTTPARYAKYCHPNCKQKMNTIRNREKGITKKPCKNAAVRRILPTAPQPASPSEDLAEVPLLRHT